MGPSVLTTHKNLLISPPLTPLLICFARSACFAQADDDEEIDIVDPKEELVEVCNKEEAVTAKWNEYMACADRIAAKGTM